MSAPQHKDLRHHPVSIDSHDYAHAIKHVVKELVPEYFADHSHENIELKTISGGITNILVQAFPKTNAREGDRPVLIRLYGENTELLIDREKELETLVHLAGHDFACKPHGTFDNGRIEQWMDGKSLEPEEMTQKEMSKLIAFQLGKMHSLSMPHTKEPSLWTTLELWGKIACEVTFDDSKKAEVLKSLDVPSIAAQVPVLKEELSKLSSPVVFSHNDLLSGNIMYNKEKNSVDLIDFEYASYNFRGFDIANHFCEWAGFDGNYDLYPTKEQQMPFFTSYFEGFGHATPSQEELELVYREVNKFAMASHLYWALWAVVQAKHSVVDFDYLDYTRVRYNEYCRTKDQLMAL